MKDVLIQYIKENLLVGQQDIELSSADDLLGSGLIDSLGIMRLITFVEEEFSIKVAPQDMTIENFESVDALGDYIKQIKAG